MLRGFCLVRLDWLLEAFCPQWTWYTVMLCELYWELLTQETVLPSVIPADL